MSLENLTGVKPEDCWPLDVLVTTVETTKANASTCPTRKNLRCFYFLHAQDTSGAANTLTIKIYNSDDTVDVTIVIKYVGYDILPWSHGNYAPILRLKPGQYITWTAAVNNVQVHAMGYDL